MRERREARAPVKRQARAKSHQLRDEFTSAMHEKLEKFLNYDMNAELFRLNDQLHAIKRKSRSFKKNPHARKTVKFALP